MEGEAVVEKSISAMTARKQFGQILEETHYRGDTFIIERAGRPMAAMIPIEQYQQWRQRRSDFFATIERVQERTGRVQTEELEAAISEAVAAVRAGREVAEEQPE